MFKRGAFNHRARKPFTPVLSEAVPMCHLQQDPVQLPKENEIEPDRALQSLQAVEFEGHQVKGSATSGIMAR